MIVIKMWREDRRWAWVVQEIPTDRKKVSVVARGSDAEFSHACVAAVTAHDAAEAGRNAAQSLMLQATHNVLTRGRK